MSALHTDMVKLEIDEAQAKGYCQVAGKNREAMRRFVSVLDGFYWARHQVFRAAPRNVRGRSPQDVQAMLAGILQEHMPVMDLPEGALKPLVDTVIRESVTYKSLWDNICTVRDDVYQLICTAESVELFARMWHLSLQDKLLEARREILSVRCTCKRLSTVVLDM